MFDILRSFFETTSKSFKPIYKVSNLIIPSDLKYVMILKSYVGYSSLNVICKSMLKLAKTCKGLQDELNVQTLQVYLREPGV